MAAFAVGSVVSPVLAGNQPFGRDGRIAALTMKADRWDAVEAAMQAGSPDGWNGATNAWDLARANHTQIAGCREVAAKTKKDQRCLIPVAALPAHQGEPCCNFWPSREVSEPHHPIPRFCKRLSFSLRLV
jgi:hypothetical protein